jgi:2'-5' RNA ligase
LILSVLRRDVYSVNALPPSEVTALASSLAGELPIAHERSRGEHTLVAKRLGQGDRDAFHRLAARAREVLVGTPAFEARVTGVDLFEEATSGSSPVVYLVVESPGLVALHHRLCKTFDPVEEVEGEGYVPHVTIARGGAAAAAHRLADREIDPLRWTVTELTLWDARRRQPAGSVSLPA